MPCRSAGTPGGPSHVRLEHPIRARPIRAAGRSRPGDPAAPKWRPTHPTGIRAQVRGDALAQESRVKRAVYLRHGVTEHLVWRVFEGEVDWWVAGKNNYEKRPPGPDGVLRSTIFAGLWLDPGALSREDHATLLALLERGLATAEHAAFKNDLHKARTRLLG